MIIRRIAAKNEGKKLKVAAYCRVSTDKESQEDSLELQRSSYQNMIAANPNWEFAGIYADEGRSGVNDHRPEFQRMIEDAKSGKVNKILVKSISRFSRNILDCRKYIEELSAHDVSVFFEKEGIDSLNPGMLMMLSLSAAIAQDESRSNSENHHWSNRKRVQLGQYKIGNNQVLGYDADENGKPIPNQDSWIIKMIFELYAEGKGLLELRDIVNKAGGHRLRSDKPLTHKHITYILRNEIYVGDKLLQKRNPKDLMTKKPDLKREKVSKRLVNDHEPIISRELWEKVQARLNDPNRKRAERRDRHWLAGKLICAECGQPYMRRTYRTRPGSDGSYKAWECKGRLYGDCKGPIIKEDKLLEIIDDVESVDKVLIGEEIQLQRVA